MFASVQPSVRTLDEQRAYVGDDEVESLISAAAPLRGARLLNLSVSPFGTSVAETLHTLVPLLQDLGIEAEWQIVGSEGQSGDSAQALYQGLTGREVKWTPELTDHWRQHNKSWAEQYDGSYDLVIVHDPQPAGLPLALDGTITKGSRSRWVWHCHLDLHTAQPEVWQALLPALEPYDRLVFSDPAFVPEGIRHEDRTIIAPAIDPAGPRNAELSPSVSRQLLSRYGLDPSRPLLVQVASLDSAFDPMGAVDVYRRVRTDRSDVQLMLVHPIVESSMDAWSRFEKVARHLGGDPDARVLVSQGDGGQTVVNAAQRAAAVVLQRAVPAGFACQVWEAQWKGKPVVVGAAGALPGQIVNGETGYIATSEDSFAESVLQLLDDQARAAGFGEAGRNRVRANHLITRLVSQEIQQMRGLLL